MNSMKFAATILFLQVVLETSYGLDLPTGLTIKNACLSSAEARMVLGNMVARIHETAKTSVLKSSSSRQSACVESFSKSLLQNLGEGPCHPLTGLERSVSEALSHCAGGGLTTSHELSQNTARVEKSLSNHQGGKSELIPLSILSRQFTFGCGPAHWCCVFIGDDQAKSCFKLWCSGCRFRHLFCSTKGREHYKQRGSDKRGKSRRSKTCWWYCLACCVLQQNGKNRQGHKFCSGRFFSSRLGFCEFECSLEFSTNWISEIPRYHLSFKKSLGLVPCLPFINNIFAFLNRPLLLLIIPSQSSNRLSNVARHSVR